MGIYTSPQAAEITLKKNQILFDESLKSKNMVNPQFTIFSPKTASESLFKVVDALNSR